MDTNASTYGGSWAEIYDEVHERLSTPEIVDPIADLLAELAGDGPALELGIGTGRIALPLAGRGVEVHGIDVSEAMVAKLREKPGGDRILVTIGDFESIDGENRYPLIYVIFNTLFVLPTQEAQVNCFRSVARHLSDGGVFVVEAFVPEQTRFRDGQRISAGTVERDRASVELERHDPVSQTVNSSLVYPTAAGVAKYPIAIRYAWPSELDLMARLAGMRLRERWGDWRRSQFTASSGSHISVYEPA